MVAPAAACSVESPEVGEPVPICLDSDAATVVDVGDAAAAVCDATTATESLFVVIVADLSVDLPLAARFSRVIEQSRWSVCACRQAERCLR